jgi:hypothetical protein
MSRPTRIERGHYGKLAGRRIIAVLWQELEGRALPVLLLDGTNRDGNAATVTVLCDPEGNGPGHLEHWL